MTGPEVKSPLPGAGSLSKSPQEIMRVLEALRSRGDPIVAQLGGGKPSFSSRVLLVDPERRFIVVARSADAAANAALLARPRCDFACSLAGWHVEFVAAEPQPVRVSGNEAIRLRFPEVMVGRQRRTEGRTAPRRGLPLRCLADAGGVVSFSAHVIDISAAGVGILLYSSGITLEPGTVLRGCIIEHPATGPVCVDMEVRYSEQVKLKDGRRARRSGCRFVNRPAELKDLVRLVTGDALAEDA
jgi:flagellar brake protein